MAAAPVGSADLVPRDKRSAAAARAAAVEALFSFAGGGIVFAPTDEQLARFLTSGEATTSCRNASFEPVIETPHGPTQAEIRMMYVWTDRLRAVLPLVRMGRGTMMGVDHGKGLRWVGASAGFVG